MITASDFDVNILKNALTCPNVTLTFPLPTDRETYLPLESNRKVSRSFELLENFIDFFAGTKLSEVYKYSEYTYSMNKASSNFNTLSENYMNDKLALSDKKLDEIVFGLVDLELSLNLIKPKDFPERYNEVKSFMVRFYKEENAKNLPKFGSTRFIRLCYLTVINVLAKMFPDGIWTNRKQFSNLYQQYLDDPMSIILLPNHQSHIDYVILHLIMIRFQMSIPTVIAGDNLNVAIFGSILKGLGAIFIKRSFNNEAYTERNIANYIEFILLNKIHFEVFIEGTRSRDGKVLLPKFGVLKMLASIYQRQRNEVQNPNFDLLMQPVSITYERVYEADGYLQELVGKDKEQESFFNIMKNGVSSLIPKRKGDCYTVQTDGFVDNSKKTLSGKVFVRLAQSFTYSSFANNPENAARDKTSSAVGTDHEHNANLKKLGFKILHSINEVAHMPEIVIVGITIQTFYYYCGLKEFFVQDLITIMDRLIKVLEPETSNIANKKLLKSIAHLSNEKKCALIESQILKFFRFIQVNPENKRVRIVNTFELLYYKNLSIHLIINKCLVSFILLRTLNQNLVKKLYHILTGVLRNEFLFDYDYNESHDISNILKEYQNLDVVSADLEIKDLRFHELLATIVQPFIDSFAICVERTLDSSLQLRTSSDELMMSKRIIDDETLLKRYPTTKGLLRIIQKDNLENFKDETEAYHVETYNKQYLLSTLLYLDNIGLIKIHKNKKKTKAFIIVKNVESLQLVSDFLQELRHNSTDEFLTSWMLAIVDKEAESLQSATSIPRAKL